MLFTIYIFLILFRPIFCVFIFGEGEGLRGNLYTFRDLS